MQTHGNVINNWGYQMRKICKTCRYWINQKYGQPENGICTGSGNSVVELTVSENFGCVYWEPKSVTRKE